MNESRPPGQEHLYQDSEEKKSRKADAERITSVSWWKALSEAERKEMIQHVTSQVEDQNAGSPGKEMC
ncbi:hypothetical protein GB937_005601 [Aspergillus fischeri]|nr:hypothetical protein GB937_005601 [Aspergillus fischeri]